MASIKGVGGQLTPENEKSEKFSNHKVHRFRVFHRGLCAAVNPLPLGSVYRFLF